jgi:hypothetical protein
MALAIALLAMGIASDVEVTESILFIALNLGHSFCRVTSAILEADLVNFAAIMAFPAITLWEYLSLPTCPKHVRSSIAIVVLTSQYVVLVCRTWNLNESETNEAMRAIDQWQEERARRSVTAFRFKVATYVALFIAPSVLTILEGQPVQLIFLDVTDSLVQAHIIFVCSRTLIAAARSICAALSGQRPAARSRVRECFARVHSSTPARILYVAVFVLLNGLVSAAAILVAFLTDMEAERLGVPTPLVIYYVAAAALVTQIGLLTLRETRREQTVTNDANVLDEAILSQAESYSDEGLNICIYLYLFVCICISLYLLVLNCFYLYIFVFISIHLYLFVRAGSCSDGSTRQGNQVCVCVCVYVCVCVCICSCSKGSARQGK